MYLVEALKYNVPAFHEDRLTQIIAATFNESKYFQRVFLKFLRLPYLQTLSAKTQVANENAPSRPDLVIFNGEIPHILVESKVGAKSNKDQQVRHSRLKAKHLFLIVRDPVAHGSVDSRFRKVTWFDFFSFLMAVQLSDRRSVDTFLIDKLITFGRECNMLLPDKILRSDFENACALFTQVRLMNSPSHSFERRNPFQSLDSISLFLERALIKVKDDPFLGTKIRPFVKRLNISSLFDFEIRSELAKDSSAPDKREIFLKSDIVTLEKEIRLKRAFNSFCYLYVRASFIPHCGKNDLSDANLKTLKKIDLRKVNYKCEVTAGLRGSNNTFHPSDSVCFDDKDDLEFSDFYRDALKIWKRKLIRKKVE
jgi:hypothetical protein